jgi:hypothetical protein
VVAMTQVPRTRRATNLPPAGRFARPEIIVVDNVRSIAGPFRSQRCLVPTGASTT